MFLAAVSMLAMTFLPLWQKADLETSRLITMNAYEIVFEQQTANGEMVLLASQSVIIISIAAFIATGVMLLSIFKYKSRMTQVKLNALFSLLSASTIVGIVYYSLKGNALMLPEIQGTFLLGFYLPIVAMFNNFLANRFIRKDEALVKSADRIR
jgi:glucan phosphoethanolaminetransferase (alkaline phosphatase superfamily)